MLIPLNIAGVGQRVGAGGGEVTSGLLWDGCASQYSETYPIPIHLYLAFETTNPFI